MTPAELTQIIPALGNLFYLCHLPDLRHLRSIIM